MTDPSVAGLPAVITERAAGLPFAAEEIVRDLVERGELEGDPGAYLCVREVGEIHVPASLQTIIGARIDRLTPTAKRTLHAAAVIGPRFDTELLETLLDTPSIWRRSWKRISSSRSRPRLKRLMRSVIR